MVCLFRKVNYSKPIKCLHNVKILCSVVYRLLNKELIMVTEKHKPNTSSMFKVLIAIVRQRQIKC